MRDSKDSPKHTLNVFLAIFPILAAFTSFLLLSSTDTDDLGFAAILINPVITPIIVTILTSILCLLISFFRNIANPDRKLEWYDHLGYSYQLLTVFIAMVLLCFST